MPKNYGNKPPNVSIVKIEEREKKHNKTSEIQQVNLKTSPMVALYIKI
jgi:hypothetical protein